MSKTKKPAQERDEMRARLAAMSSSSAAPGQDQAKRAMTNAEEPKPEAKVTPASQEQPADPVPQESSASSPATRVRVSKKPAVRKSSGGAVQTEQPVERCSVQLYREDLKRLDDVEKALRKQGLVGRSVSTSMLMRVALAVFDETTDLSGIAQRMKELDGRGRR